MASVTGTAGFIEANGILSTGANPDAGGTKYVARDGFDLVWLQSELQTQMATIETDIRSIENNANLSDTEKMFSMQMSMNTWSAVSNLRTNMLKSVSDTLKTITRNVS